MLQEMSGMRVRYPQTATIVKRGYRGEKQQTNVRTRNSWRVLHEQATTRDFKGSVAVGLMARGG